MNGISEQVKDNCPNFGKAGGVIMIRMMLNFIGKDIEIEACDSSRLFLRGIVAQVVGAIPV